MDTSSQTNPEPSVEKRTSTTKTDTAHEPRNFLATFLLTSTFGTLGLRHFYLGSKKLGWLRLGLFVGGYALVLLAAATQQTSLFFIAGLAILTAVIWAIADFFYVYFNVKSDAEGQPLTVTSRDKKWASVIFWTTIGLFVLGLIAGIIGSSYANNAVRSGLEENNQNDFDYNFQDNNTDTPFNIYQY